MRIVGPGFALAAVFVLAAPVARAVLRDRIAAVVNGQVVTLSEVEDRVGPELSRLATVPEKQREEQKQGWLKRALEQLIDEKLIEAEAATLGVEVAEDDIEKQVEALARQNNMTTDQFREAIKGQGYDYGQVRDSLRRQSLQVRLLQYKVKPRRVSDEEVQAAYATQTQDVEEEVRARHLFVATPEGSLPGQIGQATAKADQAIRRIRAGEDFAKVATELSDGPSAADGGDLGYFRRGQMLQDIEDAAFKLQPGKVSGLIRTPAGYHLVKVEDRRKLPPKPLAEVQEDIRNRLSNDSVLKERDNYLKTLRKGAQIDIKL